MLSEDEKIAIRKVVSQFIENNNIISELLTFDKKLVNLEDKLVSWLEPIPSEARPYFLHLFGHFKYFDRLRIIKWFEDSYENYMKIVSQNNDTLFIPVCSFGGVMNGATSLLDCMNEASVNLSKNKMAAQPRDFYDENDISSYKNIVLVDDIVGSGDTLIDFIERTQMTCPDFFENKSLYILPILFLEKGKDNVLKYAQYKGLNLNFLDSEMVVKAFSNLEIYPHPTLGASAKKIIKHFEELVASEKIYTFGYKRSEALVAFYFNTPNNTLSTFHEKNDVIPWNPVFPRKQNGDKLIIKETSTFHEIRRRKEERKKLKLELAKEEHKERRER